MKNKNLTIRIAALLLILASQTSFTKDAPKEHRSQLISTSDYQENQAPEYTSLELEKFRLLQEEMFDGIKDQANTILYSLQQVEQVLIANKIKFDETKISKKELLQEIKGIKAIIEAIYSDYQTMPASQGVVSYMILNKGFMDYLLICMQKDVTMFNGDKFDAFLADMFDPESAWSKGINLETNEDFDNLRIANEKNCATLIEETENFGLTDFNKAFRYFQDKPMSITGKPIMATCQDIALYSSIAALICGSAIYVTTDNNIPSYLKAAKEFIGDVTKVGQNQNNSTDHKAISLGLFGSIDNTVRNFAEKNGNLLGSILTLVVTQSKPIYDWATEKSSIAYKKTISYLRGEVDKTPSSRFESQAKKVYAQDMIGCEHLEKLAQELADYIKHPLRYENSGTCPEKGILLTGEPGTGKSFFAERLQTIINDESGQDSDKVKFRYINQETIEYCGFDSIFAYARENAPFILFFDEVDMNGIRRDKDGKTTNALLANMSGLSDDGKKVMVIAATNRPEELDGALLRDGRFGTQHRFEKPTYENRKKHLIKTLAKHNISKLSADDIDAIAQETEGCIYATMDKIIKSALRTSMQQSRLITAQDFEDSLDYHLRQIRTNVTMNDKEKEVVAMYHAGQAAARYILSTIQQVIKITIHAVDKPVKGKEGHTVETNSAANKGQNIDYIKEERIRAVKLGNVFTLSTSNNLELISDKDQEDELLALLAGQAALELLKGQCYNNFGKEDRAKILHALEIKISQGGAINDVIRLQALTEKDILSKKIKDILAPHTALIKTITDALLDHNTIDKYEWATIIKNYTN